MNTYFSKVLLSFLAIGIIFFGILKREAGATSCPVNAKDGRYIINFNAVLKADSTEARASHEVTPVRIPAGTYKVQLVSGREGDDSDAEQWYVTLGDAAGETLGDTPAIRDLKPSEDIITRTVSENFRVSWETNWAVAYHAAYLSSKTNAVRAVCAVFDRVADSSVLPTVSTTAAINIQSGSAELTSTIDPQELSNTATWFEWGTTTDLGNKTTETSVSTSRTSFAKKITGLGADKKYYFRAVARNANGTKKGEILSFKTADTASSETVYDYKLTASPSQGKPGNDITVEFTAPSGENRSNDWVAIYVVGDASKQYGEWRYTDGKTHGFLTFRAPKSGTYELRYLKNAGFTDVTRSNRITVSDNAVSQPTPQPSPQATAGAATPSPTPTGGLTPTSVATAQLWIATSLANTSLPINCPTTGCGVALSGNTIRYQITVQNTGTRTVNGVVLKDQIPSQMDFTSASGNGTYAETNRQVQWNIGTLTAGQKKTLTLETRVKNQTGNLTLENVATVSATGLSVKESRTKMQLTVTQRSGSTTPVLEGTGTPGLKISFNNTTDNAGIGEIVEFDVVVENTAGQDLSNAILRIMLPAEVTFVPTATDGVSIAFSHDDNTLVIPIQDIAKGSSRTISVKVSVQDAAKTKRALTTRAEMAATAADGSSVNTSAFMIMTINPDKQTGAAIFSGKYAPTSFIGWIAASLLGIGILLLIIVVLRFLFGISRRKTPTGPSAPTPPPSIPTAPFSEIPLTLPVDNILIAQDLQ